MRILRIISTIWQALKQFEHQPTVVKGNMKNGFLGTILGTIGATLGAKAIDKAIGSGSEGREPYIKKTSSLSPFQQKISKGLSEYLEGKVGTGLEPYGKEVIAPLSPKTSTAFENIEDLIDTSQTPLAGDLKTTLTQALSGKPSYDLSQDVIDKYIQTNIRQPLREQYQETLPYALEEVRGRLGGTPATSLGRVGRDITEDYMDALAKEEAATRLGFEKARMGLAESAADRALSATTPSMAFGRYERQRPFEEQQIMSKMGEVERQLEQAQLDWDYKEYLRTQPENAPYIGQALAYLGIPTMAGMGVQGKAPKSGVFGDLAGQLISNTFEGKTLGDVLPFIG